MYALDRLLSTSCVDCILQYEILRVFPIVVHMTKMVLQEQRIVTHHDAGTKDHDLPGSLLPKDCRVYLSSTGTHYNERHWKHPHIIEPYRWMSESPNLWDPTLPADKNPKVLDSAARIPAHTKGTFLTFSEGARACLGRKFALVEYVAFFAGILRNYRIKLGTNENPERVERVLRLRCAGAITLAPAEDVKLFLVPRGNQSRPEK